MEKQRDFRSSEELVSILSVSSPFRGDFSDQPSETGVTKRPGLKRDQNLAVTGSAFQEECKKDVNRIMNEYGTARLDPPVGR